MIRIVMLLRIIVDAGCDDTVELDQNYMIIVILIVMDEVMMMIYLARPESAIFTIWLSPTNTFLAARSLKMFYHQERN